MNLWRTLAVVLLVASLAVGVSKASSTASGFSPSTPCNAAALVVPYHGPLKVQSVQSFGCVGRWAYLWATVGTGVREIGVTEVLRYDATTSAWKNASREKFCDHHHLPTYVEFWGCNSN